MHLQALWKWFWGTVFSERYSSATQGKMGDDCKKFLRMIEYKLKPDFDFPLTVSEKRIIETSLASSRSVIRNGILCLLALLEPRDFYNGSKIPIDDIDFSKKTSPKKYILFTSKEKDCKSVVNFCFLTDSVMKEIHKQGVKFFLCKHAIKLGERFSSILNSHLIPFNPNTPELDFEIFMKERAQLIMEKIKEFRKEAPLQLENQEQKLVEKLEKNIRKIIHNVMIRYHGLKYWDSDIPKSVKEEISRTIKGHLKQHSQFQEADFDEAEKKLEFCYIRNYREIISHRWNIFSEYMNCYDRMLTFFETFNSFRNHVQHHRSTPEELKKDMEKEKIWFQSVFSRFREDFPQ